MPRAHAHFVLERAEFRFAAIEHRGRDGVAKSVISLAGRAVDHARRRRDLEVMRTRASASVTSATSATGRDGIRALAGIFHGGAVASRKRPSDVLLKSDGPKTATRHGHNNSARSADLSAGNGSLLSAVAMMAAGWDGAPRSDAPVSQRPALGRAQ